MSPRCYLVSAVLTLTACGGGADQREAVLEPDPAIAGALAAPLMTDPDLASLNQGNAAIRVEPFDGAPAWTRSPVEISAAQTEAIRIAGGPLRACPEAGSTLAVPPDLAPPRFAAELPAAPRVCVAALRSGFGWAADLPSEARLYPGAHVVASAGAGIAGCSLRALRYVTAALPQDVLDFHFTLLSAAGYRVERASGEGMDLLTARKDRAVVRALVRTGGDGMTEVALATLR